MTAVGGRERLRVSNRSVATLVALLGLTLLLVRMASAASRVIGWMLVAAAVAGLLHPLIRRLEARGWPRGRAVLVVAAGALLLVGLTTYRVVDDVAAGVDRLRAAAPEAARLLELREDRVGEFARAVHAEERTTSFLRDLPARLRGGTPADAFRAATTRGVAFLTTSVLTLFLLLHGPKLADAAVRQLPERRRAGVERVGRTAYRRAFGYASGSIATALLAAAVAYAAATAAGVPGAAPLALWVGLWDLVPIIGAFVGAVPIVLLAAVADPARGAVLAIVFLAYQLLEDFVLQPRLESRTMRLGPFLTVAAGFAGLEVRGLPGALIAVLAVATVVAALDQITPRSQPR